MERAISSLGEGTQEGRLLARRLIEIASREESRTAIDLLGSLT